MDGREELLGRLADLARDGVRWIEDIPLPHGVWTLGNRRIPHTRLRRVVQAVQDFCLKPLSACRVIDLGCLDGIFSLECGLHGASVLGIDARKENLRKAELARDALGLANVRFQACDVREVRRETFGDFDAVICSGLLYHLSAPDVFEVLENLSGMTLRGAVFDTHVSLKPTDEVEHRGKTYHGHWYQEHKETDGPEAVEKKLLASYGNRRSFWLSRPSLLNALARAGFGSVYEGYNPAHLNFGEPGIEHRDRCTFVALKGPKVDLKTSPCANDLLEEWPEGTLDYAPPAGA